MSVGPHAGGTRADQAVDLDWPSRLWPLASLAAPRAWHACGTHAMKGYGHRAVSAGQQFVVQASKFGQSVEADLGGHSR